MTLSAWGVYLSWKNCDNAPYFINKYDAITENAIGDIIDIEQAVKLSDGTEVPCNTFIRTETEIYPCYTGWMEWEQHATSGDLWLTLQEPIDPTEITGVWYQGQQVYKK